MTSTSVCKKTTPPYSRKSKRDPAGVRRAMMNAAGRSTGRTSPKNLVLDPLHHEDIGLPLGKLEDHRWCVSPSVAKDKLLEVGLPCEGRRAGLIYSWASIFRAEGIDEELAKKACRETHADLFEDLIDTAEAAAWLGYKDTSSIRKLVLAGHLPETAFVQFGLRGVYRFRAQALPTLRKNTSIGRIV